jgi:hypothetical protein
VADVANAASRAVPEALSETRSTTMAGDLEVEASHSVVSVDLQSAESQNEAVAADTPWLARVVGWLVPIVWVIWGIGLILGLLLTLIAQWGASRLIGGTGSGPTEMTR